MKSTNSENSKAIVKIISHFSISENLKKQLLGIYKANNAYFFKDYFTFSSDLFNEKIERFFSNSLKFNIFSEPKLNEIKKFLNSEENINKEESFINLYFQTKEKIIIEFSVEMINATKESNEYVNNVYNLIFNFKSEKINNSISYLLSDFLVNIQDELIFDNIFSEIQKNVNHFISLDTFIKSDTKPFKEDEKLLETFNKFYIDNINDITYQEYLENKKFKKIDEEFKNNLFQRSKTSGSTILVHKDNLIIFSFIYNSIKWQWLSQDKANEIVFIYYIYSLYEKITLQDSYSKLSIYLQKIENDNDDKYYFFSYKNKLSKLLFEINSKIETELNLVKIINKEDIIENNTELIYTYKNSNTDNLEFNTTKNMNDYFVHLSEKLEIRKIHKLLEQEISKAKELEEQIEKNIKTENEIQKWDNKRFQIKNQKKLSLILIISSLSIVILALSRGWDFWFKLKNFFDEKIGLLWVSILFVIFLGILISLFIWKQVKKNKKQFDKEIDLINNFLLEEDLVNFKNLKYSFSLLNFKYKSYILKKNKELELFTYEKNNNLYPFNFINVEKDLKKMKHENKSLRRMYYNIKKMYYWKFDEKIFENIKLHFKNELNFFLSKNQESIIKDITFSQKKQMNLDSLEYILKNKSKINLKKSLKGKITTLFNFYKPEKNIIFNTFVFDLDGTLLNDNNFINEKTKKYLKNLYFKKNKKIVIATGRPFFSAKYFVDDLNISCPIISYNGLSISLNTKIENNDYENIYNKTMDIVYTKEIARELFTKNVDFSLHTNQKSIKFNPNNNKIHLKESKLPSSINVASVFVNNFDEFIDNLEIKKNEKPMKFIIIFDKIDKIEQRDILDFLSKFANLDLIESQPNSIDVMIRGISKGKALKFLMDKKIIAKDDRIIAFGDSENDITFKEVTNYFVAMKNTENLKVLEAKTYITKEDNNNDGVIRFLKENQFNK
ncbi:HAD-IIB family hydrolase [Mycoplasma sp. Z386]